MPFLTVEHPVTYTSWELGRYTTYDICVDCSEDTCPLLVLPQSCVPRRYSQFKWLRRKLRQACSYVAVPSLPTAGCLLTDRFTKEFIENRRKGLEEFIRSIYSIPTLLSEASFHLFVQTNLTTSEIDGYLRRKWGKLKEVSQVVCELNRQKFEDEQDEISSIASCSRWSDASAVSDMEDPGDDSGPSEPSTPMPKTPRRFFSKPRRPHHPIDVPAGNSDPPMASEIFSTATPNAPNFSESLPTSLNRRSRRRRRYCSNAVHISSSASPAIVANVDDSCRSAPGPSRPLDESFVENLVPGNKNNDKPLPRNCAL